MEIRLAPLVRRCQAGDEAAWEALVRSQQGRVFALACHYVGDRDEAHDLAQECFVRVFQQIGQLEDPERFVSWMLRIVRNAAIDRSRRRKARPPAQDVPADEMYSLASDSPTPEDDAELASSKRLVHRALGFLGFEHREIVMLKDIQGMEFEQISKLLDLPVGTLKSRSHRARSALARQIQRLSEVHS